MRILRIAVLLFITMPVASVAQSSFWLHKPLYTNESQAASTLVASDSLSYVFAQEGFYPAVCTDYGKTWRYAFLDTPLYHLKASSISCLAHPASNLILLGYNAGDIGHVLRSTDNGTTWKDTSMGTYAKDSKNFVAAMTSIDSNHLVVIVDSDRNYFADHLYLSFDQGISWTSHRTPDFHYYARVSGEPHTPLVTSIPPNIILVAAIGESDRSVIYRTTNFGVTWDTVYRANTWISKIAFSTPQIGFAAGLIENSDKTFTATIDKTTDAGLTWSRNLERQIVPISTSIYGNTAGLFSIAFADSLHGLACGYEGLILQTANGGNDWNEMRSDYTFDANSIDYLGDVAYPDLNHAMIVSSDGAVLIYHPEGLLELPNITYPKYSPPSAPRTFDITWDPVPNATRYSLTVSTFGNGTEKVIFVKDTMITSTYYHLSDLIDTSPPPATGGRDYFITLQAFNATNQSNIANRMFIVYQNKDGVLSRQPLDTSALKIYPNPATHWLNVSGFDGSWVVTDALGREYECTQERNRIDISKLPAGVYYLKASGGFALATFVKN